MIFSWTEASSNSILASFKLAIRVYFAYLETNLVMLSMALTTLVLVWSTINSHVTNFIFGKMCYQEYDPVYKHNVNTWSDIFCAMCE